jgi:hypothetical protein
MATVARLPADLMRLDGFRRFLRELDLVSFAALLREQAAELYNRNIRQYQVLIDVSDEMVDAATLPARARITDRWLLSGRVPRRANGSVKPPRELPGGKQRRLR